MSRSPRGPLADDLAAEGNSYFFQGHVAARSLYGRLGDPYQSGAAGHFHVDDGQAPYFGYGEDGGQFLDVGLSVVELWAADDDRPAAQQPLVEIGHRKGHAVGHQEQVGGAEERGVGRH